MAGSRLIVRCGFQLTREDFHEATADVCLIVLYCTMLRVDRLRRPAEQLESPYQELRRTHCAPKGQRRAHAFSAGNVITRLAQRGTRVSIFVSIAAYRDPCAGFFGRAAVGYTAFLESSHLRAAHRGFAQSRPSRIAHRGVDEETDARSKKKEAATSGRPPCAWPT